MKILLMSVGTRGDMEPFLAIGELLRDRGHHVVCAFPEQFRDLAQECNLEFGSLGRRFLDTLDSDVGRAALGGGESTLAKISATIRLAGKQNEISKELIERQYELVRSERPDRIVYNGKAVFPLIWEADHAGRTILLSPVPYVHYVKGHTHLAFHSNFGPFLNKLTYSLADFGLIVNAMISARWIGLRKKLTFSMIRRLLSSRKVIYTISPSLFSAPEYWSDNIRVLGYQERKMNTGWRPDEALSEFVEKHGSILFITFGSMTNPNPKRTTKAFLEVLLRNGVPSIINTAAGGLVRPDKFNSDLVHFTSEVPYDWAFPRMYGVIHHGGSGTTHKALRYGCATMIIPHILDQFVWNKVVGELGAGPTGMKIGKFTPKNLEPKILDLLENAGYKKKAKEIAAEMREEEDLAEELYAAIVG